MMTDASVCFSLWRVCMWACGRPSEQKPAFNKCVSLVAWLKCQLNLWLKGAVTEANHQAALTLSQPEARDTISTPASNYLPSLSVKVPRRVLTAGGSTGRWPRISSKTYHKSSYFFPDCSFWSDQHHTPFFSLTRLWCPICRVLIPHV